MASVPASIGCMQERLGDKVRDAYLLAAAAHAGQWRQSGDDYIVHPLAVAEILFQLGAETDLVCAALLHDVLEDGRNSAGIEQEIRDRFGDDVLYLVCAVSKDRRVHDAKHRHAMYVEQIAFAFRPNPFVLLLKLADLLDNLLTVGSLPSERGEAWMQELKYDYLPLFADGYHRVPLPHQPMYRQLLAAIQMSVPSNQ